jgi:hypothetical protein
LFAALEFSFLSTGHPRDLTIVHALGIGDGRESGLSRFAHQGMVRRVIGGHWSWSPEMQRLAKDDLIEAYSFPAGVISNLMREIGAKRPGMITRIGLGTFADPRLDGGRCNGAARDALVEVVTYEGREFLCCDDQESTARSSAPPDRIKRQVTHAGAAVAMPWRAAHGAAAKSLPKSNDARPARVACAPCAGSRGRRRRGGRRAGFSQDLSSRLPTANFRRSAAGKRGCRIAARDAERNSQDHRRGSARRAR